MGNKPNPKLKAPTTTTLNPNLNLNLNLNPDLNPNPSQALMPLPDLLLSFLAAAVASLVFCALKIAFDSIAAASGSAFRLRRRRGLLGGSEVSAAAAVEGSGGGPSGWLVRGWEVGSEKGRVRKGRGKGKKKVSFEGDVDVDLNVDRLAEVQLDRRRPNSWSSLGVEESATEGTRSATAAMREYWVGTDRDEVVLRRSGGRKLSCVYEE